MRATQLTSAERWAARIGGALLGVLGVAALLWVERPIAKPPTMGTDVAVAVGGWDGVYPVGGSSEVVVRATDLRAGGAAARGRIVLRSNLDRWIEVGMRLDEPGPQELAHTVGADAIHLGLGRAASLGSGPTDSFAEQPRRTVRLAPHGRLELPVRVWVPERFGAVAVGLELDLRLRPVVVGERR